MNLPGAAPDIDLPVGTRIGRVVRVDRGAYTVVTADGPLRLPALPPPETATVGDWLAVDDEHVVALLPRTSLLREARRRAPARRSRWPPTSTSS